MSIINNNMISDLFDQDGPESYLQSFEDHDDNDFTEPVGISTGATSSELLRSLTLYRIEACDYHDYSQTDFDTVKAILKPPKPKRKGPRGGVVLPFPVRLHNMLEGVEKEGLSHVVSWQQHGRSFLIHKPKEFADIVMPKYFKQSKLTSFQRQMNLYGFRRISSGTDRGAYYHELFLRTRLDIAKIMFRTKFKSGEDEFGNSRHSHNIPESNFYDMPLSPFKEGASSTSNITSSKTTNTRETNDIFDDDTQDCVSEWGTISREDMENDVDNLFEMLEEASNEEVTKKTETKSEPLSSNTEEKMSDIDLERALECLISTHQTYLEKLAPIEDNQIEPTPMMARCMDATNGVLSSAKSFFADKTMSLTPNADFNAEMTPQISCNGQVFVPDRKRMFSQIESRPVTQSDCAELKSGPNVIYYSSTDSLPSDHSSQNAQSFLAELSNNCTQYMSALNRDTQGPRKMQRLNGPDDAGSLSRAIESFNSTRECIQNSFQETYLNSAPIASADETFDDQSVGFLDDADLKVFNSSS